MFLEGLLQGGKLPGNTKPFDSLNVPTTDMRYRNHARILRDPIEHNRAGPAAAFTTTVFSTGKPQLVPKHPQQGLIRFDRHTVMFAIDFQFVGYFVQDALLFPPLGQKIQAILKHFNF